MKKIIYIIFLTTLFSLASCSDFLDKEPYSDPSTDVLDNAGPETAIALVNGAYQPLQRPKLYNFRIWTTDIWAGNSLTGGEGNGTDGAETIEISEFRTTTANDAAQDVWRGPNPGILYCNMVLEKVPAMNIDRAIIDRCVGEAKFLRAHYYFILVQLFGDVPMTTSVPKEEKDYTPARTDKMTIYNEIIIPDLKEAIELLPTREEYASADIGRASKGAAAGMLAKVYITLGMYNECLEMCNLVESLGYTLNPGYGDCFGAEAKNKNTAESLFEIHYSAKNAENVDFWHDQNQACWLSTYMGPRNSKWVGGAYGWNLPTQEFVDQYEEGDLRKDITILYDGCPPFNVNGTPESYRPSSTGTGYNVRKFLVPLSISPDYNTNSASVIVLRYADILLLKAEALNELGQTDEAEEPLYEVRKRAGLVNRADVENLTQDEMRDKIRHERRIELAFEGVRWFDMVRWDNGQYALDFLHSIGRVNASEKHLLLPIPQADIDANPNLVQNPGY